MQLSEDRKQELDEKLQRLISEKGRIEPVTITFFQSDERKAGGSYRTVTGQIRKFDMYKRKLLFKNGAEIDIEKITDINGI